MTRITAALVCPNCGASGVAVWQAESSGPRAIVSIAGEFHSEEGRTALHEVVIVCNACDEILMP